MTGISSPRMKPLLRFVIAGIVLINIGYYFKYMLLVSERSSVSGHLQEQVADNEMLNHSMRLYSAFIDENYGEKSNDSTKHVSLVSKQIIVLAWQTENIIKDNFKCCILQGNNNVITSESTKTNECCYNKGLLRARRIVCQLIGNVSNLIGVSLAKLNMNCPNDKQYYITPTILDPALKKNKWAMCIKYFYGPRPSARRLVEWFEFHRFLGADKFTIHHESTINSATKKVLQFYGKEGLVNVLPIDAPYKDTIKRHDHSPRSELFGDEQIGVWDCRERHKYYEFAADVDTDEFILPGVIKENAVKEILAETFRKSSVGVVTFYTYVHITSWEPTNASYPLFIGQYENSTEPLLEAPKNMYMPSRMTIGDGTIHAVNPRQGFTRIYLDPSKAALHHFRPCRHFWFKPFPAKIFRNGTVAQVNVTCSTLSRVRPIVKKEQDVKKIERMVEQVISKLRI